MINRYPYGGGYSYIPLIPQHSIQWRLERRSLRHTATLLGVAMIVMELVSSAVLIAMFFIMGNDAFFALTGSDVGGLFLQIGLSVIMFVAVFAVMSLAIRPQSKDNIKPEHRKLIMFSLPKSRATVPAVLMALGLFGLGNLSGNLFNSFLDNLGIPKSPAVWDEDYNNIFLTVILLIVVSVLPALVEEFAMRGVVMGTLRPFGDLFAVVVSSIFFGVMHTNRAQIPFAFVAGLGLGFAVIITRSIWTGIIVHFINNLIVTLLPMLPDEYYTMSSYLFMMFLLICGVVGAAWLLRLNKKVFNTDGEHTEMSGSEKAKAFFTTPAVVIALGIILLSTVLKMLGSSLFIEILRFILS